MSYSPDSLFMLHTGMSKFQVINYLNSRKDVSDISEFSWWCDFETDSSRTDSIYKTLVECKRKSYPNIANSYDNFLRLSFVDQKLCKIEIILYFKPARYNDCSAAYNYWNNVFKSSYVFSNEGPLLKDVKTKEQRGQYSFFFSSKTLKEINVEATYEMIYEQASDEYGAPTYETGKIDRYQLTLSYTDSKGTKLEKYRRYKCGL